MDAFMLEPMNVGDRVEVEVREQLAWKAVLLAYIVPFLVMIAVITILDIATALDEAVVGSISLASMALYFLVLRLFRSKLQKQFSFTARKL